VPAIGPCPASPAGGRGLASLGPQMTDRPPRRRVPLAAVAASLALGLGLASCGGGEGEGPSAADGPTPTSASEVPYDPSFAFKQRIPTGAALDPRSAAIVGQLDRNHRTGKVFLDARGGPPVYVAARSDPFYAVEVGGVAQRFRVPADARPGGGADHPLVILDPNHPDYGRQTELRLFKASVDHDGRELRAEGAGLFRYNNDGRRLNPDGSRSVSVPFAGQGTGSGLSVLAGLVRASEVRAGRIRHALRFSYSARDFSDRFRAPAVKTDQPKGTTTRNSRTAMDMGMRLQLDPSVDCDRRTVPGESDRSPETRLLRMICRALQEYGMIAVDGTGDRGLILMMENTRTGGWDRLIGPARFGTYSHLIRNEDSTRDGLERGPTAGIPWDRFRVLKRGVFPADR
jgi:hypothetical protein